jgi:hypothetical protein
VGPSGLVVDHAAYNCGRRENSSRRVSSRLLVSHRVDTAGPARHPPDREVDEVVVLDALACDAATTAWCVRVRSLLLDGHSVVVTCDVGLFSGRASDVVDTLARLQLTALRCGGRIRLCRAGPSLLALLELVGLAEVLPVVARPRDARRSDASQHVEHRLDGGGGVYLGVDDVAAMTECLREAGE